MNKDKVEMKKTMAFAEAADYLAELHKHFKQGKIVIVQGEDHVVMTPPDHVTVEIEAKQKKGKQKFSLEVSWVESEAGDLTITDTEPEPPAKEDEDKAEDTAEETNNEESILEQAKAKAEAAKTAEAAAKEKAKPAEAKPAAKKAAGSKSPGK